MVSDVFDRAAHMWFNQVLVKKILSDQQQSKRKLFEHKLNRDIHQSYPNAHNKTISVRLKNGQ